MLNGTNYRLYTFINFYLSSIQMGIQSAHIVSELFSKYYNSYDNGTQEDSFREAALNNWASNDKTIIVLNGGTSFDIRQDYITVDSLSRKMSSPRGNEIGKWFLPVASFTEDHNALGAYEHGVVTGFGIVVPQEIWDAKEMPPRQVGWAVDYDPHRPHLNYQSTKIGEGGKIVSSVDFWSGEPDTELISLLKSKSLAR